VCDPAGCTLAIDTTVSVDHVSATVSAGTAPYQFEWNIISGDPLVSFSGDTLTVTNNGWTIEVIVTDAAGCRTSMILTQAKR
ncbi:MAG TPA: hypothetical protein VFU15_16675, partial [Bacteroidia bacterium]|nr:hypothetical protein [Bacteroidia bacterium]